MDIYVVTYNNCVEGVFYKYEKAVKIIKKQGFKHFADDLYKDNVGNYKKIEIYEVQ